MRKILMMQSCFKALGIYGLVLPFLLKFDVEASESLKGTLAIYGRNVNISGVPQSNFGNTRNVPRGAYEDFDITAKSNGAPWSSGFRSDFDEDKERKFREWRLDKCIPYLGGENPELDCNSIASVPWFIMNYLRNKLHPSLVTRANDFFENVIVSNTQKLHQSAQPQIPDQDCLFYRKVNGEQHLFLRISSQTQRDASCFNRNASGRALFAESADSRLAIVSRGNINLNQTSISGGNILFDAKNIFNKASNMEADGLIYLKAENQRHFTVLDKWTKEESGRKKFYHAEGIERIDGCTFKARQMIQEGGNVENYGIFVEADEYIDRGLHTTNLPVSITLHNYALEKKSGWFSSATSSIRKEDDFLVPTTFHVNYYRSESDQRGASVKYGYTVVLAGAEIKVTKDIKEDVPIHQRHTVEIREKKSGFTLFGGVKVPNPAHHLEQMQKSIASKNMIGLTASTIGAIAKGIQIGEDIKVLGELTRIPSGSWSFQNTAQLMGILSHIVSGPCVQFGSRTLHVKQEEDVTLGNTFIAPEQIYENAERASFAGEYRGTNITIKTRDLTVLDLPHTMDSETSMHQTGVSMDLLSFAISLATPHVSSALKAAIGASSVSINAQEGKSHQIIHRPTTIEAQNLLEIEAENGYLTQAQIKAGIIHAIFTNDLVLETLANEKWEKKNGGGMSFGLGGFANFKSLQNSLKSMVTSMHVSSVSSRQFEKTIDDFAYMVGEKEFYLKVGNILRAKSALFGHKSHNPEHERIEAKKIQSEKVPTIRSSWDNSFELNVGDLACVASSIGNQIRKNAIKRGASKAEAEQEAEDFRREVFEEQKNVERTSEKIVETEIVLNKEIASTMRGDKTEQIGDNIKISESTVGQVVEALAKAEESLIAEKDEVNASLVDVIQNEVQRDSLETQNELLDEQIQQYEALRQCLLMPNTQVSQVSDTPSSLQHHQSQMTRSGSEDNLLQDTWIRRIEGAMGKAAGATIKFIKEADSMTPSEYIKEHYSFLSPVALEDSEVMDDVLASYVMCKVLAKTWQGLSKLDDVTGNIVSGAVSKFGELLDKAGTYTRRFLRDDVGLSQRVAQNAGDLVTLFAPGTAAKGVSSVAKAAKIAGTAKFAAKLEKKAGISEYETKMLKSSINTALKQRVDFVFQEAGLLNGKGALTEKAIKESTVITGWDKLGNKLLKEKLDQINPNKQWAKVKTKNIQVIGESGQSAEIHFYKNLETNQVFTEMDFKIKTNNNLGVGLFKPGEIKK